MKTTEQRINNIVGQLEGIKKLLVPKEKDCFKLIIQLKAIKSATAALMEKVVQEELNHCLRGQETKRVKMMKIFEEIIKKQ